ncbi:MAG TPA: O-antigen ligase family protein [Pseudomonadales bacterium]|nr:O-antigen ligase family protein [Pseudomonadales bacterium]
MYQGQTLTLYKHWSYYLFNAYLGLLIWLPLPFASKSVLATSVFNLVILCISLTVLIKSWKSPQKLPEALNKAVIPLTAFSIYCCWLFVQIVSGISINPFRSEHQLLLSVTYVQLFFLTLLLVNTRERLQKLLYVLVACGVFQSLYGSMMMLSGTEKVWWLDKVRHIGSATGTFMNRNQFANYLVICLACGCGLLIGSQRSINNYHWRHILRRIIGWLLSGSGWLRMLLAVIVIGIVLSHSRMGNTSLFFGLTFTGLLWLWRRKESRKNAFILIGSLLVIDTFIVGTWFGLDKVIDRLESTKMQNTSQWIQQTNTNPDNTTQRASSVNVAAEVRAPSQSFQDNELRDSALPDLMTMATQHWLTGIGAGNFSTGFTQYSKTKTPLFINEAHFDELQFLVESGITGIILLAIAVSFCAYQGMRALMNSRSRFLQGAGFAVTMSILASMIHSVVEFNFQVPATASLFIVMLAIGIIARTLPDKSASKS